MRILRAAIVTELHVFARFDTYGNLERHRRVLPAIAQRLC